MDQTILDPELDRAMSLLAPGTDLSDAIEMILAGRTGALICIGDVENVLALGNGGFKIDVSFTPQRLFELAKMDGAIVLDEGAHSIIRANFHLNPDPLLFTDETGMRHRTAARTSMQTDALVISVSQRRAVVNIYRNGEGVTLDSSEVLLSKANQGILALQNSRGSLDKAALRLTLLEFDNLVTLVDVAKVLARYQVLHTISRQVGRYICYLGVNGSLLKMQLTELMQGASESFTLAIRDYAKNPSIEEAERIRGEFAVLTHEEMTDPERIAQILGLGDDVADECHLEPLGLRVMSRISMLSDAAVLRIVEEYGSLAAIVSDSEAGFAGLDSLGVKDAHAVAASLSQLRGHVR